MKYELYHMRYCPYCVKVQKYIEKSGREDIVYKDIQADPLAYRQLLEIGKKDQVPCLIKDGKALYESDDIIAYLQAHPQGM